MIGIDNMKEYIIKEPEELKGLVEYTICFALPLIPLIRCKDCKYWWKENELCTHEKTCNGNVCCLECDSEFYCGYAKRKSD
jgi:hypothetical protein